MIKHDALVAPVSPGSSGNRMKFPIKKRKIRYRQQGHQHCESWVSGMNDDELHKQGWLIRKPTLVMSTRIVQSEESWLGEGDHTAFCSAAAIHGISIFENRTGWHDFVSASAYMHQ
jgi:hypothetical protein